MFLFGNSDLTNWVSKVSIQEEYDAIELTAAGTEIGLFVGGHRPVRWRITAIGFAFGDTISQLRSVLTLAKQQGLQRLQFQSDRMIMAYLDRFYVQEWDSALLVPNVRMEFVGVGYAIDPAPQVVSWAGAANTTNYFTGWADVYNRGEYEAPIKYVIDLTYPHQSASGNNDLELILYLQEMDIADPRSYEYRLKFWVRDQTAQARVTVDSGVSTYTVNYDYFYKLLFATTGLLLRIPKSRTVTGRWQVAMQAHAINNNLLQFTVHSAGAEVLQRYANW